MKSWKIAFILGITALLLSLTPLFINIISPVTSGRVNPYWDNWPYDFTYYQSIILEGKNGQILTKDKYTSEPQSGVLLRTGYIALGHLTRILNTDGTTMYHAARTVLGALFIMLIYLFISKSFPSSPRSTLLVFFFTLFIAGIPEYTCTETCKFTPRLWSMTQLDPIRRLTFLPHFLWGNIAFLSALITLLSSRKRALIIVSGIILGLAGLDHPPSLLLLYPVLVSTCIILYFKKMLRKRFFEDCFLMLLSLIPFIIYLFFATQIFPWNLIREAEFGLGTNFLNFALAMGPLFIVGLIMSIYVLIKKKNPKIPIVLSSAWLLSITVLTFFFEKSELFSQTRFIQVGVFIPSAILSGYAFSLFYHFVKRKIPNKVKFASIAAALLLTVPTLPTLYLLYYDQIDYVIYFTKHTLSYVPYPPVVDFPTDHWIDGMAWLKNNTPHDSVVLSDFTAGNYIPAYAGNTVFYGHEVETYLFKEKQNQVKTFFQSMTPEEQQQFLLTHSIDYIFLGPQERAYQGTELSIPEVNEVYRNPEVTIFEVK